MFTDGWAASVCGVEGRKIDPKGVGVMASTTRTSVAEMVTQARSQIENLSPRQVAQELETSGVTGGSGGGVLPNWTVGHTDRFKAACSERAVNNTYTLFGTSDIGSSFSETQAGVEPWQDRQWFIDHSPLTYAPGIYGLQAASKGLSVRLVTLYHPTTPMVLIIWLMA